MPPKKTNQEVLDEATKAAQEAARVSGLSYSGYSPTAITSDQLRNAEAVKFPTVPNTPTPQLPPADTALQDTSKLGTTEQSAQDLASQMFGLTQSLAGKEQYRLQQEQAAGIGALEATQKDLTSQYNALVNEQAAIPLALQEELKNRPGVSVRGATSVEEQSRQRQNAIKALTVNSLLQSTQGNIANARATADRAVALKYADQEAQLSTLAKSLDIIQKSPAYTEEQKQRALKQQVLLDDRKRLLDQKKEDDQTILAMANLAMKNNPGDQGAQMAAQQAIASGDIKKAFSLLGQYQDNPEELKNAILDQEYKRAQISKAYADKSLTDAQRQKVINEINSVGTEEKLSVSEAQTLGVPFGTTKAQAEAMGKIPVKPATAAQETTALYANRLEQSNSILSDLDKYASGANPISYAAQQKLPDIANALKSANFQSIEQAQRNFVNATLRRESGAVISPSEFENARRQYFAMPGDTPQTVAQKKANRDLVQKGFIEGAGSAYTPIAKVDDYASFRSQLKPGEILVNRKGKAVAVTQKELLPSDIKL